MMFPAGTKLGRYQIRSQIGAGGMGEVYLAEDLKLLRQIALKVLSAEFCEDDLRSARFLREAQAASALNHPNICTIYEINDEHRPPFIVMEYVEGETLAERIKAGGFEIAEILRLTSQLAGALSDAHAHGIIHRDIKPANIIVTQGGQLKILDFGIAKRLTSESEAETQADLTHAGFIAGTVGYMSPEQARGLPVDARTDVWSVGVVLYEMLTLRHPFAEATNSDTLAAVLRSEPESLRTFNGAIPQELERIVLKALCKDRAERYAGAKELFADLKQVRRQLELAPDRQRSSTPRRQREADTQLFKAVNLEELSHLPPHKLSTQHKKLVGRSKEIGQIKEYLRQPEVRLMTLTGVGGTGKTTLAQAVAGDMLAEFSNGVFFVELAAIAQPELMASTIAHTLGVVEAGGKPPLEALKDHLREKHLLLVLDNFEQVLPAAADIAELLAVGPVKILVTSRAVLHLSAELEFTVSPLAVPTENTSSSLAELENIDSVRLFVERARSVRSDFELTEENAASVAEICTRLDGLPLAIELAAARIKILTPQAIQAKLGNSLNLLTGGPLDLPARQQTMRGAVEWSYDLLTEDEKRLFRQLAVFAGGFTIEAAEAICDGVSSEEFGVLDLITSLVDKSLLVSNSHANRDLRFRMLGVIREYAGEVLEVSGDAEAMRERHAIYFLALGEADLYLDSAKANQWINRLREERYNLRSALRWSLVNDPEVAARLAAGLRTFWILEGYLTEGREWLEEALRRSNEVPASVRRKVLIAAGSMAQLQGDREKARNLYAEGVAESRAAGDLYQLALATRGLGATAYLQGDFRAAREYVEEALLISRELNDRFAIAASLNRLGDLARVEENFAAAQMFFEDSIAILRQLGNINAASNGLTNLGAVAFALADYEHAGAYFAEALMSAQEFGGKIVVSHALDGLAALAVERGDSERAARLAGAAEELRQVIGFQREPAETRFRDAYLSKLRRTLSEPTLSVAHEAGRKLKLNEAVALALTEDARRAPEKKISAAK